MATITLGEASRLTGLGKSTLARAIKAGRLSATRTDTGTYEIDTSELFRVYAPASTLPVDATGSATGGVVHHATPDATAALLEAQIESLKTVGDLLRRQVDDLRGERDAWRDQAQRFTIAPPPQPVPDATTPWRRFLRWRRSAAG